MLPNVVVMLRRLFFLNLRRLKQQFQSVHTAARLWLPLQSGVCFRPSDHFTYILIFVFANSFRLRRQFPKVNFLNDKLFRDNSFLKVQRGTWIYSLKMIITGESLLPTPFFGLWWQWAADQGYFLLAADPERCGWRRLLVLVIPAWQNI